MEKIKMGIIGFGCRSYGMTSILLGFDDVEVVAVCDKYEDRVENGLKLVKDEGTVEEVLRKYIDHVNFMKNIKI